MIYAADLFGGLRGWGGFGPRFWLLYFDLVWLCGYTDLLCLVWVLMGLGAYAVSRLVAWGIAVVIVLWSACALRFGVIYKVFWVGFCVMGLLTSSLCCLRLLFGFDLIW